LFVSVVVVCANQTTVREILLAAEELNMVGSGEYVFFNIELYRQGFSEFSLFNSFLSYKCVKLFTRA